ncbi:MAG: DUF2087 domain-containing protein [Dehalococcoidia bacterium]
MTPPPRANEISLAEFQKRLVTLCVQSGNTGLPRKQRDRHILLKSVTLTFDRTRQYAEEEVNQKLLSWLRDIGSVIKLDHVILRRVLVDEEFLGRSPGGSRYWVAVMSRKQIPFDPAIDDLDVPQLVSQGKALIEQRKQEYLSQRDT